jgi:hypothetical protein
MTREFAIALASEVTRNLSVKATPVQRGLSWVVELTTPDGAFVTLRDATDWVFLLAEQRSLGMAA